MKYFLWEKKLEEAIVQFRLALSNCNLHDMGYSSPMIIWINKRGGHANIHERLDHFLCNEEIPQLCPLAVVDHLNFSKSDHSSILLQLTGRKKERRNKSKRDSPFQFEPFWVKEDDCFEAIRNN